jgi:hypothetical protein
MCQKAAATAASLMQAIEPTIVSLLTLENLNNTANGIAAISAYNAALAALQNWKQGTPAQNVLQLIGDFQIVFNTLPIPATAQALANIILAGVEAVIGVVTANSPVPTPAPASANASEEETTASYQAQIAAQTEAAVAKLVPNFKRSIWHSAAHQYKGVWNSEVETGGFPPAMKV